MSCRSRWTTRRPQGDLAKAAVGVGQGPELGEKHGYRNAQASVIAPTGTIGLVMDCDTTGIEPDFALVKFKKLAGGGYFKIINRTVPSRLAAWDTVRSKFEDIVGYAVGYGTLKDAPGVNHKDLAGERLHGRRYRSSRRCTRQQPSTSSSLSTAGRSARISAAKRSVSRMRSSTISEFDLLAISGSPNDRYRSRERLLLRRDDPGRRPASEGRTPPRLRLRKSLRPDR